jgi:lipopolysaccharide transport system ATP-binding protein
MDDIVVRAHALSKRYRIGLARTGYRTLREAIWQGLTAALRFTQPNARTWQGGGGTSDTIWALRDVTFEVPRGEVVGIIGRNGSGKSTLLKILSRITRPTTGWAEITGRIGTLLEVGTGFHPELTGRDNIFLNGAILGMKRAEITSKFDEIVAFAEVEKFIDTPVKHFSSGMYLRLAFAVAAHLEPDILIIDEVLAVGDASFQQKCLEKIREVAHQGGTVLFVSHNMHAVGALCTRVLWIDGGQLSALGPAPEVVGQYVQSDLSASPGKTRVALDPQSDVVLSRVRVIDSEGTERVSVDCLQPFAIEMEVLQRHLRAPVRLVLRLRSLADGSIVLATTDWDLGHPVLLTEPGQYTVRCEIPANLLNSGNYLVSVGVDEPGGSILHRQDDVLSFTVVSSAPFGDRLLGERDGVLSPYREWKLVSFARPGTEVVAKEHTEP